MFKPGDLFFIYKKDTVITEPTGGPNSEIRLKKGVEEYPLLLFGWGRYRKEVVNFEDILKWARDRVAPESRDGILEFLRERGINEYNADELVRITKAKCIQDDFRLEFRSMHTPVLTGTSSGDLSKELEVIKGEEYLIKGTSGQDKYEPLSEYFASKVFRLFGDSIDYELVANTYKDINTYGYPYVSRCKKHSKPLIPLMNAVRYIKGNLTDKDVLDFIKESLDVNEVVKVFLVDALIGNEDRHWNNFDIIQEGNKFKLAPALDFGRSLLYNIPENELQEYTNTNIGPDRSKPFGVSHGESLGILIRYLDSDEGILNNKSIEEILDAVERGYKLLPGDACSVKRLASIKSYLKQRYEIYTRPYIKRGGRFGAI